jgi:hypothetical protein
MHLLEIKYINQLIENIVKNSKIYNFLQIYRPHDGGNNNEEEETTGADKENAGSGCGGQQHRQQQQQAINRTTTTKLATTSLLQPLRPANVFQRQFG